MPLRLRSSVVAALLLAVPGVAAAEEVLGGADIEIQLRLPDGDGGFVDVPASDDQFQLERQFNLARCFCAETGIDDERTQFQVELSLTQSIGDNNNDIDVWLGQTCFDDNVDNRTRTCGMTPVTELPDADVLNTPQRYVYRVDQLVKAGTDQTDCVRAEFSGGVYVAPDPTSNNTYADEGEQFTAALDVDPEPPPTPGAFTAATGAEGAIEIDWEGLTEREDDVYKWQMLCARTDGTPAFSAPTGTAWWETAERLCGASTPTPYIDVIGIGETISPDAMTSMPDAAPIDAAMPDAAPAVFATLADLPAGLQALDPDYLCGEASGSATSIRIEGLENGTNYYFVLLAVDRARNVHGVTTAEALTPREVTDFWEDLHDNGSQAEGGFCLFVETYGDGGPLTQAMRAFRDDTLASTALGRWLIDVYYDDLGWLGALAHESAIARVALSVLLLPVVLLALLWHALTLPGLLLLGFVVWRLRRARKLAITAAALLAPAVASAQTFSPYWEDETYVEEEGPDDIKWHVGVKVGPYVPAIDAQLGMEGDGPYQHMFGGYNLVPILDVDHVLFHVGGGQLTVGGSLGFLGKTAKAFTWEDTNDNGTFGDAGDRRVRSEGDETSFRLIPLSLDVGYRVTILDDDYGIPVIPYLRGGLGYYVWWITRPSGDLAEIDGNKARGATLGLVGSAGLAVRAERVDRQAAATMRDSGLYHAGFYAEYQLGWVDGFGNEKKLAVGDNTFFVGFDFEF